MIDSHCHFDFPEFDNDREKVWQRSLSVGIQSLLIPGTESRFFSRQLDVASLYPQTWFALGLHPWFLGEDIERSLCHLRNCIKQQASNNQFIAIGETGLDFGRNLPHDLQIQSFEAHLQMATEFGLPVVVHHYKSHNKIIELLKQYPKVKGVIHAFSGSGQVANSYIELGYKLGIGGTITYGRSIKTCKAIKRVGLEHLLLETDAPAMPLSGHQGQRNSPEYLPQIANQLALLLETDTETVVKQTSLNFSRLFKISNNKQAAPEYSD